MGFWTQAAISFIFWLAAGYGVARNGSKVRAVGSRLGRAAVPAGAFTLFIALGLLFWAMSMVANSGGFGAARMSPLVWLIVTVVGAWFISAQTVATILLAASARQAAVTSRVGAASRVRESINE